MTALEPIFDRLGLQQYYDAFVEEGFDTWETVLDIHESDLDSLNVKLGHRRKLQRAIADYRGIASDQPLGSPLQDISNQETNASDSASPQAGQSKASLTTTEQKRRYRRHPKPDDHAPERPPSAYVLFSNRVREEIKAENLSFTDIARLVGTRWQTLPTPEKHVYQAQAEALKETYNSQLADYKKTDRYKQYQDYVAEFKIKHGGTSINESKRPKLEPSDSPPLSATSPSNATGIVPLNASHMRSGSIGSSSTASVVGHPSVTSGPTSRMATSLPNLGAPVNRRNSPRERFAQEQRHSGRFSSRSSISEESSGTKLESPDIVPSIAQHIESHALSATPSRIARRDHYDSGGQIQAWSGQSPPPSAYGSPISAESGFRPMGSTSLPTGVALPQEGWLNHAHEASQQSYRTAVAQNPPQPSSLTISQLVAPTNMSSTGTEPLRRTLPPLPEHSSLPTTASSAFSLFGTPSNSPVTQQHQSSSRAMAYRQGQGREHPDITDNEAASTLAGIAERPQDYSSTKQPKHEPGKRR